MRKASILLLSIAILFSLVSCNADAFQRVGKLMAKTNFAVFGAEVSSEKTQKVSKLAESLGTAITGSEKNEKIAEVVSLVQQIKSSPTMLAELNEILDKPVEVEEEVFNSGKEVLEVSGNVIDLAVNFTSKMDDVKDMAANFSSCQTKDDVLVAIQSTFKFDASELLDDTLAKQFAEGCAFVTNAINGGNESQIIEKYNEVAAPIMDFFTDLAAAQKEMADSIPSSSSESTGRSLLNGAMNEKLFTDMFMCGVSVLLEGSGGSDAIVQSVDTLIKDLDTIAVINSGVEFPSLDSLAGKLLEIRGSL